MSGESSRCDAIYGLDAAGLAASKEAVHAHRANCRVVCAREAMGGPERGPGDVGVGVVLQFEGGGLGVRLCFEEGAPGLCALGEGGGEKGGERVREEIVHFGGVQYWLVGPRSQLLLLDGIGEDGLTMRLLSRMSTITLRVS